MFGLHELFFIIKVHLHEICFACDGFVIIHSVPGSLVQYEAAYGNSYQNGLISLFLGRIKYIFRIPLRLRGWE